MTRKGYKQTPEHRAKIAAAKRKQYEDPSEREAQRERTVAARASLGMDPCHGMVGTSTYEIWKSMIKRCTNPKHHAWKHYGGRGITVCERWRKFVNFLADMGERPEGLTLDRADNSKGYSPENCRWATWEQQAGNRRPKKRRVPDCHPERRHAAFGLCSMCYKRKKRAEGHPSY